MTIEIYPDSADFSYQPYSYFRGSTGFLQAACRVWIDVVMKAIDKEITAA